MDVITNIEKLSFMELTTDEVVKELDRIKDILFDIGVISFELLKIKNDIWFKICEIRNNIWFKDNVENTRTKLLELRNFILSFKYALQ